MNETLFHRIAQEVEWDFRMSGLTDGIYEQFAHVILERYLREVRDERGTGREDGGCTCEAKEV